MDDKERLYIDTIAKYRSITRAAEQLFISQPSLTQALQRIESLYGAEFFHRGKNGLQLTEKGEIYLETTAKMEELYAKMEEEVRVSKTTRHGHINFGTTTIQGGVLLPEFMSKYRSSFPNIELNLIEASATQLERLIQDGTVDLAMMHRPFLTPDISYASIYQEPLMMAVPPDDPDWLSASAYTDVPTVTAEIMAKKSFILPNREQRVRQLADGIFAMAGIVPTVVFETSSTLTSIAMVGKGAGAAVVPRYLVNIYKKKYGFEVFKFPASWGGKWELVVGYRNNRVLPTSYRELIRILQETVASMPEVFA